MEYQKLLDREMDPSKLSVITSKYRENSKNLSDQIDLLIEISETLSKILDLFE
jgi:hypothetical protein